MVNEIPELPLVVSDKVQELTKTKQAVIFLRRIRAWTDIQKVRFIIKFKFLQVTVQDHLEIFCTMIYDKASTSPVIFKTVLNLTVYKIKIYGKPVTRSIFRKYLIHTISI